MKFTISKTLSILLMASFLAACGGGGSGDDSSPDTSNPTPVDPDPVDPDPVDPDPVDPVTLLPPENFTMSSGGIKTFQFSWEDS